jgi:hypothetical protein
MPIQYRDRVDKLLRALKQIKSPEAKALVLFMNGATARKESDQLSLSRSFERIRDLASWAKSSIDQE